MREKGRVLAKPTTDRSRVWVLGGAFALALTWYVLALSLLPDTLAQIVSVTGALILAIGLPLLRRRDDPDLRVASQALDALGQEVWLIDQASGRVAYRNATAAARVMANHQKEIAPTDQLSALEAVLARPAAAPRVVLDIAGQSFRPFVTPTDNGRFFVLVLQDVRADLTEQKIKEDFVATVSHELRSPLTSIKGSMGLLLSNAAGELPNSARVLLEISHRNAERLVLILNDILDLQKIADDGMAFERAPLDAVELVHEAIAASSVFMQRFDLEVQVIGDEVPVMLHSDANRLMQVLGNLLSNAAKFSPSNGMITVRIAKADQRVVFSVSDQGEGIPPDEQFKIFERFADMSNSDRQKKGGSGLGLSICKAIVDKLGGTIGFESQMGQGTCFFVSLPQGENLGRGGLSGSDLRRTG